MWDDLGMLLPEGGGAQGSGKAGERHDRLFYLLPHLSHFLRGWGQELDVSTRKVKHTVQFCCKPLPHTSFTCRLTLPHTSSTFAQRLLEYIRPDFIHIMQAGEIIKTGDMSLVDQLEASGYSTLQQPAAVL